MIPIISFLIMLFLVYYYNNYESITNMEASSILPVLYDSSLSNKTKITDLLGIPVNDISYNNILNSKNKDADFIISSIKQYIGSSVTFNTSNNNTSNNLASSNINTNNISSTPSTTNANTTKPNTFSITQTPFKDRLK